MFRPKYSTSPSTSSAGHAAQAEVLDLLGEGMPETLMIAASTGRVICVSTSVAAAPLRAQSRRSAQPVAPQVKGESHLF